MIHQMKEFIFLYLLMYWITRINMKVHNNLRKRTDIVIKQADKGGSTVILNRTDYVKEGTRQLADTSFYQRLTSDQTEPNNLRINSTLNSMLTRDEITPSLYKKLCTNEARTPQLYFLPKIHKGKKPPPGRPIVSANGCPTEKISAFVDLFLRPHLPKIPSYLRDTSDLLMKLRGLPKLKEDTLLCTLDVSSLYTNIPNLGGLQASGRFLSKHRIRGEGPEPSNQSLMQLLNQVLTMNSFKFNGEDYLQVAGTAMGTRVAPTYANIFMAEFEDRFVYTYPKKPLLWVRFIDDILLIWDHGEEELQTFISHLNNAHKTIKFTTEISKERVNFLDTSVVVEADGQITTDLFVKPTDSNNYLLYTSAHPKHCKRGIPYGQFLRLRRICSNVSLFTHHCINKDANTSKSSSPGPSSRP